MRIGTGNETRKEKGGTETMCTRTQKRKEKWQMVSTKSKQSKALWVAAVFLAAVLFTPLIAVAATPQGTVITNEASADYSDANANNYTAISNTTSVTVTSVFTVSVTTPTDQSGPSNDNVVYAYTVTNTGNDNNTFALSAASGAGGNTWTATLIFDTNGNDVLDAGENTVTNSTGVVPADNTYKFFVVVTIPVNTLNGQTDDTVLTVIGAQDGGAGDDATDTVTTTALAPAMTITKQVRNTLSGGFAGTANAKPGETLEYQVKVENTGAVTGTSVVLTDNDGTYTTYVANSIWIGTNATTSNGAGNINRDDDNTQEAGETCAIDACGQGSVDGSGNVSAYLGNTANETTGGTLGVGSVVYVYFQVTVD
jgi:uncharacterized repeat protein (TIGR01451 family)